MESGFLTCVRIWEVIRAAAMTYPAARWPSFCQQVRGLLGVGTEGTRQGPALFSRNLCPAASRGPASRQGDSVFTMHMLSLWGRNFIITISIKIVL